MHAEAAGDPGPWRQQALLRRGRRDADALRDMSTAVRNSAMGAASSGRISLDPAKPRLLVMPGRPKACWNAHLPPVPGSPHVDWAAIRNNEMN